MRPIYFYAKLKEESWKEKSLTFLLLSSWIVAALITLAIFILQYIPIGATLVEGISGWKFPVILPVLITLALVFFVITFLILGGAMVVGFGAAFYLIGFVLHYVYLLLGGKGSLNRMVQSSFYSSAVVLVAVIPVLLSFLTKFGLLEFSLFRVGFDLIFVLTVVYVYGLWAVAGRKTYAVPRWKAFIGALLPVIGLLIFLVLFDKIGISKLEAWITPLK
jgi:hypothetical protein